MHVVRLVTRAELFAGFARGRPTGFLFDWCETPGALLATLRRTAATLAVVEVADSLGQPRSRLMEELSREFPTASVVAVGAAIPTDFRAIVPAARAGATDLIMVRMDDPWLVLVQAARRGARERAVQEVAKEAHCLLPPMARTVFECCLDLSDSALRTKQIGPVVGRSRATVARVLSQAGLPGAAVLAKWARLLVAVRMLEDPNRVARDVARALNFRSSGELQRLLEELTGYTMADLACDGFRRVLAKFASVTQGREVA